ncbi:MAG: arylsulfatase [Nitratireductor sp.]|nr:arylsulfatase [Nitratireductor sp.]
MQPIHAAFAAEWPQAELMNILDDSLSLDRARDTDLSAAMTERIVALGDYAESAGAEGILYTCSAFGAAIEAKAAQSAIPVLKPNEAMFLDAFRHGLRIGMLATFGPSVSGMEAEFRAEAARNAPGAALETVLVADAIEALKGGDARTHDRLVAAAAPALAHCDAILLAHFSTSRAAAAVREVVGLPVLTAPGCAVRLLRTQYYQRQPA